MGMQHYFLRFFEAVKRKSSNFIIALIAPLKTLLKYFLLEWFAYRLNPQRFHLIDHPQLGERRSAEWEVAGSNPGWTNTQGL